MTEHRLLAIVPPGARTARHPEGDGWIVAHPDFLPAWHRLSGEVVILGEFGQLPPSKFEGHSLTDVGVQAV